MKYKISIKKQFVEGNIFLPSSKSISNRVLIIKALSSEDFKISGLSKSDDTKVLEKALASNKNFINIGHAGTSMRFLTALLAQKQGNWLITGSSRMQNRPIKILVDALNQIGANIEYLNKKGYPPLRIKGKKIKSNYIEIDGSVSSQYISALLLIAPVLPKGLILSLKKEVTSKPYLRLTLDIMQHFGIQYSWDDNEISIRKQEYFSKNIEIEADWSSASYLYQIVALSKNGRLVIKNIKNKSLQGDAITEKLFNKIGVFSQFKKNKAILIQKTTNCNYFEFNFIENPDLAQTFAVTLCFLGIPFKFKGLKTLKIKETNRIDALKNELFKFGFELSEPKEGMLKWNGKKNKPKSENIVIKTYNDHRMALAFAPIALKFKNVIIDNPEVVSKSYPNYWNDLKTLGFNVEIKT